MRESHDGADRVEPFPPDLEARIAAFESSAPAADFGASGWFWIAALGVALPLLLLAAGWWA